jgi:hypothetical protein
MFRIEFYPRVSRITSRLARAMQEHAAIRGWTITAQNRRLAQKFRPTG